MRYEVAIIYKEVITRLCDVIMLSGDGNFIEAARNGSLILSPDTRYVIYDCMEKKAVSITYSADYYVDLEDECRKLNDKLLYDQVISEYLN